MPKLEEPPDPVKLQEMDLDAIVAASEFPIHGNANDVGKWWKKHLWKCGHKRLGRVLLQKTVQHAG